MRFFQTEAVVLKSSEFREADRVLTLFSLEFGKTRAVCYGSARLTSRKRGAVQPFCRSRFFMTSGKELSRVDQVELLERFLGIEDDVRRFGLAHYFAELVGGFTADEVPNRPLYNLLVEALRLVRKGDPDLLARAFEVRLLALTGLKQELERCVSCRGAVLPGNGLWFSPGAGGVVCSVCRREHNDAAGLVPGTLYTLRRLGEGSLGRIFTLKTEPIVQQELNRIIPETVSFHLGYRPRALSFLERLVPE
ncbi:MAG: DNA repair protein RecO [Bacillota bacterium]